MITDQSILSSGQIMGSAHVMLKRIREDIGYRNVIGNQAEKGTSPLSIYIIAKLG
jgi:hypothetical protein